MGNGNAKGNGNGNTTTKVRQTPATARRRLSILLLRRPPARPHRSAGRVGLAFLAALTLLPRVPASAQVGDGPVQTEGSPPAPPAQDAQHPPGGEQSIEFPIARLCAAAVEAALANPERARALVVRARLAGWLPEMGFRVYRRLARTEGVTLEDPVTGVPIPVDIKSIDDVRYEWRATWDLSRIVFNPDEIPAHLEALRMADVRRDIQLMVIRLFFERKRLMSERTISDKPPEQLKSRLRVQEIEAELDALSGGAFSEERGPGAPARPTARFPN